MEFKEFEPRFKSAKTWFKLSAGLNLWYNFKWNQPYLNRRSNSLNSATGGVRLGLHYTMIYRLKFDIMKVLMYIRNVDQNVYLYKKK